MPMVVDVFNNPCCPIAQVEEARKNDNTTSYGDEEVHEDRSGKKPRVGEAKHSLSNGISAAVGARQGKVVMSLCGGGAVSLE